MFDKMTDLPVIIPAMIIESQKALSKKTTTKSKKRETAAQARAAAAAETRESQENLDGTSKTMSPDKFNQSNASKSPSPNLAGSRKGKGLLSLKSTLQ